MHIRSVNRKPRGNRYCGPAAISAVTGKDTDEAAALIRSVTGQRAVIGTSKWGLLRALNKCGIAAAGVDMFAQRANKDRPTLAAYLKTIQHRRQAGRVYLISAGHHWQLVEGRRFVCAITEEVVSVRDKRVRRRGRVEACWELLRMA